MASPIASPLRGGGGAEGGASPMQNGQDVSQTVEGLFGDAADITSSSS